MKAQKRHELQTNKLAELLEGEIERIKPYTQAIVGVLVAIAVLAAVYFYLKHMDRSAEQAASDQLVTAINSSDPLKDLQATIEDHPGTGQATVAQLLLGEQLLREGSYQLYTNKPEGRKNLGRAADAFLAVESQAKDQMLRAWALYGLGRAHESLGELDRARGDFEQLKKDYPDSSLAEGAEQHLNNLEKQSTKEFYDWFAKQDPRPLSMEQEPGRPGQKPIFDLSDPTAPPGDVNFPSFLDDTTTPSAVPAEPMSTTAPAPTTEPMPTDEPAPTTDPLPPITPAEPQGETEKSPPSSEPSAPAK